ncbi:CDP-diacylglycerol--serine O-phosphatidyltransferase [Rhodothermus marinus]|uniref:CDP-diacylglycerol--serine O-phosphatidyltransferase n=1 Tax=Rhodothermus marinus TaxID=29549 RepID=UPI001D8E7FAF|nr:CDP-diacylglycerol--serine O-phosphatidyltransferase [Rhodothermus marinus]MBO2490531.1 CDP-diacylglycerol--serine O-phosphatidyltransferase [Rhodothermus marinus]
MLRARRGYDRYGQKQRHFRERLRAYRAQRRQRLRRPIPRAAVPSFFTLMNLFSGFLAITQIHEGRFDYACWLIVLAGFFDMLDGMLARLTNGTSLFGVELDSLSDVVSFGVAPAYLVYAFNLQAYGTLGLIIASLPAVCGAVRLARFNVQFDGEKREYFLGLPIPAQAAALVALVLNAEGVDLLERLTPGDFPVLIPVVFVLSALMVTNIPFDAIPRPSLTYLRRHPWKSGAYGLALLLIIFLQQIGLLLVLAAYILHGIGRAIYNLVQAILNTPLEPVSETSNPQPENRDV